MTGDPVIDEAIKDALILNPEMQVHNLLASDIFADEVFNCRGYIPPSDCIDLAREIQAHGLLQPITVQPYSQRPGKLWRIVQGHRRFTAMSLVLKWERIPAIIKEGLTETEALILNLGENLQRKALNILQESRAIERMKNAGMAQKDVAEHLRMPRPWVQVRFYVLDFPPDIQDEIANGTLTQTQIHEIHTLPRDQWYVAVKAIKEAKIRAGGKKVVTSIKKHGKPKMSNLVKAKPRKPDELSVLLDHMMDTGVPGLHTRILAWAVGEITTLDLLRDYQKFLESEAIPYHLPHQGIPGL